MRKSEISPFELSPAMEDSMTLSKLFSQTRLSEDIPPAKAFCNSDHLSSANEDRKPVEAEDNNTSVRFLDDVSKALNHEHGPVERKSVLSGSDSVDSSHMEVEKEVQGIGPAAVQATVEASKGLKDDEQVEMQETVEVREPAMQASAREDSEESDILEHDVKVCDICGDAGREDLLAVCSRCSDGAEHTYCMKEMLQKVPEGEWLCEECKFSDETENGLGGVVDGKSSVVIATPSMMASDGRSTENVEVALTGKGVGSSEFCGPTKLSTLSREFSFKNNDKGKGKVRNSVPQSAHHVQESLENVRSPCSKLLSPKGALLKSKSFSALSSRTKIKLDEVVSPKQRGKEHISTLTKDVPDKAMSKSMSFKANPGRSIAVEAKARMLSSKISCSQDSKGPKVVREGSLSGMNLCKLDRTGSLRNGSAISTPALDRKVIACGDATPVTSASSLRDLKSMLSDGRLTASAKSVGWNAVKGASSSDKISNLGEDQLSGASRDACGIRNGGLARPRDWANYLEKARENPLGRSRQSITTASKSNFCQKCRELGHECESCICSGSFGQGTEAPPTRIVREDTHHADKFKAAITSNMLKKPGIYRRNKGTGKSGDSSILSPDVKSVDFPSLPNIPKEADGAPEGPTTISSSCSPPPMSMNNSSQVKVSSMEVGSSKDLPCFGPPQPCQVLAIPEHDHSWKGKFEVYRGNMLLEVLGGVQAHVSTWASPKVLDTVKLLPSKIYLNEVSRRSAWPTQFHECGAKDENIALYFFAEDLESYERSYKCLVEKMTKNDLALKGIFDGVELLIFASNQLPKQSQRWNMLFYLWGVFRSRNVDGFDRESGSSQKSSISASNLVCVDEDEPSAVQPTSTELSLPKCNGGNLSSSGKAYNINSSSSSPSLVGLPLKSSCGATIGNDSVKSQNPEQMRLDPVVVLGKGQQNFNYRSSGGSLRSAGSSGAQKKGAEVYLGEVCSPELTQSVELDIDKKPLEPLASNSSVSSGYPHFALGDKGNGRIPEMLAGTNVVQFEGFAETNILEQREIALTEDPVVSKVVSYSKSYRKRPSAELDAASETSPVTESELNILPAELNGQKKRLRSGIGVTESCPPGHASVLPDGCQSESNEPASCRILKEEGEKRRDRLFVLEGMESKEMHFFPVKSNVSETVMAPRAGGSAQYADGFPNLDLALGSKTDEEKKEVLPLLIPLTTAGLKKDADSVSSSLSLSLSFPFPDEEQRIRPATDGEQQRIQERSHVSTSLLLFGGLLDK
ncbi:hypothetical protein MLD38_008900 [Melastoma candidum]|uniref:Uncharacterized protein n=1 Tax=Melastoma candidum TaxID=119954 RepID=A0ACB9RYX3_9MYRT|nr:hypothetical protein MLD38_008900 [Melastoma candidum]